MESIPNLRGLYILVTVWTISTLDGPRSAAALDNGLALTPPMGWLSWERFLCQVDCKAYPDSCISERLYTSMADVMASEGYLEAGYSLVNIDDCWMANKRDFDGMLQANYTRFPHGIKWLADYVHSKGLQLGIYQDCGTKTCGGYPGSEGFFDKDARTYAKWGVDMLKLDGCNADENDMDQIYPEMTGALNRSGRPIIYSCSWPAYQFDKRTPDYENISRNCNLWRNYNDIGDSWESVADIIDYYAKVQDSLIPFSGPGAWSDPDMLVIGNFGLSVDQAKTQMAIWAILAAPLFMSTDLRTIQPEFKRILLNKKVIAVNQDQYGVMGRQIYNANRIQIWIRPVGPKAQDGSMSAAIVIHNRYSMGSARLVNVSLSSIGMNYEGGYVIEDLFDNQIKNTTILPTGRLVVRVNPTGVVMVKATIGDAFRASLRSRSSLTASKTHERSRYGPSREIETETSLHDKRQYMSSMGYGSIEPMPRRPPARHLSQMGHDAYTTA